MQAACSSDRDRNFDLRFTKEEEESSCPPRAEREPNIFLRPCSSACSFDVLDALLLNDEPFLIQVVCK